MATERRPRSSNFELMRIVLMLLIVAHHLLSNSSLSASIDAQNLTPAMRTLVVFAMWGKVAINPFVMTTGYFMCTSRLTPRRVVKLYAQVKFYRLAIFGLMVALGLQEATYWDVTSALFNVTRYAGGGFVASFFAFYLFIPFYNRLLEALDDREHALLLGGLLFWQTVTPLVFANTTIFNEVVWYATLYVLGAYLRLHPNRLTESKRFSTLALAATVILSVASVVVLLQRAASTGRWWDYAYKLVNDSNQILALATGVAIFLFFKNHPIPYNKAINTVASTVFGVLLIHTSNHGMNVLVWERLVQVQKLLALTPGVVVLRASAACLAVFVVCAALDYVRIRLLERPFLSWFDARFGSERGAETH